MSEFYNESVADEELAGEPGKLKQVSEEASDDYVRSSIRKELGYEIEERRTELQKEIEAGEQIIHELEEKRESDCLKSQQKINLLIFVGIRAKM